MNLEHLYVVILCGGGGTRLWPLSRSKTPKQFIDLIGNETLFTKTLARALKIVPAEHIYILTNQEYASDVETYRGSVPAENVVTEPVKKNTALAMGVIAGIIHTKDDQAVIINLASDQLITNEQMFVDSMHAAATVASEKEYFVTVGIKPTFPHTGLGYIQAGVQLSKVNNFPVLKVDGFREKPDLTTATNFLSAGNYFWNANLYTWASETVLKEFRTLAPHHMPHIEAIMKAVGQPNFNQVLATEYAKAKEEQIDTAISEKTHNLAVIPGDFGWTDIGSWNVVHDEIDKDDLGNALVAREEGASWLKIDTTNSLVSTGKKQIVTIGLENIIIIDTKDAILITQKDRAQDVKKVVEKLKEAEREDLL